MGRADPPIRLEMPALGCVVGYLLVSHAAVTTSSVGVTAAVAPAPAPSAPSPWSLLRPYGTLKPTVIGAVGAVESYSQPNASAVTAAANPALAAMPEESRLTFQAAQSRFGLMINEGGEVRGQLELDAIDFSKAGPTVASLPRLRIAKAEWAPDAAVTLSAGQDWDLHAPINPHGSNLVGARFLSGNSGFMRQQVKLHLRPEGFEFSAAIGMPSANLSNKDGGVELAFIPTGAVRVAWIRVTGLRLGASAIATRLRLSPGPNEARLWASAVAVYGEWSQGATNLRFEAYYGQNAANLGLLTLGFGRPGQNLREVGGFVSARQGFMELHFVYFNLGGAWATAPDEVRPSYAYANEAATTGTLSGTGPGIRNNLGLVLGYELRLHNNLAFQLEGFGVRTRHSLQAIDRGRYSSLASAIGGEVAMLVTF